MRVRERERERERKSRKSIRKCEREMNIFFVRINERVKAGPDQHPQ
jgi:hypothetical protein